MAALRERNDELRALLESALGKSESQSSEAAFSNQRAEIAFRSAGGREKMLLTSGIVVLLLAQVWNSLGSTSPTTGVEHAIRPSSSTLASTTTAAVPANMQR